MQRRFFWCCILLLVFSAAGSSSSTHSIRQGSMIYWCIASDLHMAGPLAVASTLLAVTVFVPAHEVGNR